MNVWIVIGGLAAFLGVAAGAFGAHALRSRLSPDLLSVFEVAVRYQMYHALALVLVGLGDGRLSPGAARLAGILFTGGIVIFSGSLYALALSGVRWLGAITPLGGLLFLSGWVALIAAGTGRR
jgi:uncharacterized membrane protein YgdD (TMEM256/DUF423 family)